MTSHQLQQALSGLPHGPGFRFIDRLISLEPGVRGRGEYRVRGDESFLAGHFPGDPLMPGVLMIEAGAQLAGIVAQSDSATASRGILKLTAIRSVKILGSARPGETLVVHAELGARLGGLIQAHFTVDLADQRLVEGDVILSAASAAVMPTKAQQ